MVYLQISHNGDSTLKKILNESGVNFWDALYKRVCHASAVPAAEQFNNLRPNVPLSALKIDGSQSRMGHGQFIMYLLFQLELN